MSYDSEYVPDESVFKQKQEVLKNQITPQRGIIVYIKGLNHNNLIFLHDKGEDVVTTEAILSCAKRIVGLLEAKLELVELEQVLRDLQQLVISHYNIIATEICFYYD